MGGFRTTIDFGSREVDVEQLSASATLGWQRSARWGLVASLGAILDGSVDSGTKRDVGPGVIGSVSVTWLPLFESERGPFLLASLTLGGATTTAVSDDGQAHRWSAFDLRAGLLLGKTFAERFVPFVTARGFGGPVFWRLGGETVTGTDVHHYAVGAGFTFRVPGALDLFAELLPLGEQSASVGAVLAF